MVMNKSTFHSNKPIGKEKIVGIILAAGKANRLGKPKQILEWNGEPLIRHVIRKVLESNLQSYYVVTGAYRNQVVNVIKDLPIKIVNNPNWKDGQSTSVKAGIKAIPKDTEAAIFILADQPFVDKSIINALIDAYKQTKKSIIIPTVNHQNTNPVFFARTTFPELLNLSGDIGGRKLFHSFDTLPLLWTDEKLLFDIDSIEDYKKLIKIQSEIMED